jgi:hypothetical protein
MWDRYSHPCYSFQIQNFPYEGPIFGRLRFKTWNNLPPIVDVPHSSILKQLDPVVLTQWVRLEVGLNVVIHLLKKRDECKKGWRVLDQEKIPQPHWFGYNKTFRSEDQARRSILKSRRAFATLIAMCSYTIALCDGSYFNPPTWVTHLATWVHPGWLEDLRSSPVAMFNGTVKRRGAVIHMSECSWSEHVVQSMLNAHIPIWFYCGDTIPHKPKSLYLRPYFPDEAEVVQLIKEHNDLTVASASHPSVDDPGFETETDVTETITTDTSSTTETQLTTVPSENGPDIPNVERGSRQRRGETWREFFDRQEIDHEMLFETATSRQLQTYEDRRKANEGNVLPGRRGAIVFEWTKIDGFDVRTRVARQEVENIFSDYGRTHKRYNPVENEWDLNYEFDPDTPAPYDSDDDDEEYFNPAPPPLNINNVPFEVAMENGQPDVISDHFIVDMNDMYGGIDHPVQANVLPFPPILDVLRNRHGLLLVDNAPPTSIIASTNLPLRKLQNILGCPNIPAAATAYISEFVSLISRGDYNMIPHWRWDLHPNCVNFLEMGTQLQYYTVFLAGGKADQRRYVISQSRATDLWWKPLLQDPVTIIECRRRFHNDRSLVNYLVKNGIPFSWVVASDMVLSAPHRSRNHHVQPFVADETTNSLGFRWPHYKPVHEDYTAYWKKLVTFFEGPRGPLALMMGGIVWRLGIHALGMEKACNIVFNAKTHRPHPTPQYKSTDHHHIFDELEVLSVPELEFISGMYHIYTDKGEQIANKSWWPSHRAWTKNGRDTGHWTELAERWFHTRLQSIRTDPSTALKRSSEWEAHLKFDCKATQAFREGSNNAAIDFLRPR